MSRSYSVVSRHAPLVGQLQSQFHTRFEVRVIEDLKHVHDQVKSMSYPVVVVHWGATTQDGLSRRELRAELARVADQGLVIGLIDADCPPKLRELAATATRQSLEMPFDPAELSRMVDELTKLEAELEAFVGPGRTACCAGKPAAW